MSRAFRDQRVRWTVVALSLIAMLVLVSGAAAAQALREVPRERTVIFDIDGGRVAAPDLWNPFVPGWRGDMGFHQGLIESLFYLNYETGEIMPWLATGYQYNGDFSQVTITIRRGVRWSDGQPFTARDVAFTLNMLSEQAPRLNWSADVRRDIKSARAVDDHTVVIELTRSHPRFILDYFSVRIWGALYIVPEHIWKGVDPLTFKNYDPDKGWPVFTGPYQLVKATGTEFVYDRRDDWWAAQTGFSRLPQPERLIWIWPGPEETRAAFMGGGRLDSLMDITRGTFQVLRVRNPNVISWFDDVPFAWLDPCPRYLGLNTQVKPWNDPEVRWALNHAIDREQIISIAYEQTSVPSPHLFPMYPPLNAYVDRHQDLFETYPVLQYNPSKTEEIFRRKGFTKGRDGIWRTPDGTRLQLTIATPAPWIEKKKIALMLIEQLQMAGIDAVMRVLELGTWSDMFWRGEADAFMHWSCGGVVDPFRTFDRYHSRWVLPIGERQFNNDARWANREFDAVVEQIGALHPGDPRIDPLFRRAMEIFLRELPVIPISQAKKLIPFDTTYWTGWPSQSNNYIHPPTWWASTLHIILNLEPRRR